MIVVVSRKTNGMGNRPRASREDRYWQAVEAHDRGFDEVFVYAVRSTGIYCRPSCPSRRPRRQQVIFYARPESAEQAGFRPCRRCGSPMRASDHPRTDWVRQVVRAMDNTEDSAGDDAPTLATLSARLQVSPHRLARGFKRLTGISPREYREARRLARLKASLQESRNVAEAVYDAGFGSSRAVYERAPSQLGMTPGAYRRGGQGVSIAYTLVDSPLGRLLVASTERGVCSVCIGQSDAALKKALFQEYPRASIRKDATGLRRLVRAFAEHLAGRMPQLDLPIDVQATAFQWKVWRQLRAIPYGETRSYSEIARAIGRPRAVRAVARACATNPCAVVVPCHRVIRQDGALGGYRWGLERKRALLERERQTTSSTATPGCADKKT